VDLLRAGHGRGARRAWRFFDRPPTIRWSIRADRASPLLARLARFGVGGWHAVAAILRARRGGAWMDRIVHLP
jgi:hypothetical protein